MGVNDKPYPDKTPVSFVILDNHHLTEHGVRYFCELSREFVLVTTNPGHPAFGIEADNLHIILQLELSLEDMLKTLRSDYGCERLTIQSGGTINGMFLRSKLLDNVDIVVAPVLIGGKDTATLIDGESLRDECDLDKLGALQLIECKQLEDSYIRLRYKVIR